MLKRVMFYIMALITAMKFSALAYVLLTDIERLPVMVYLSAGVVVLFGILLICKKIAKKTLKKELTVYYGVLAASVLFNLICMKIVSRAELVALDFLIIGTVMDIVIGVTFVILTARENRYIRIRMKTDV